MILQYKWTLEEALMLIRGLQPETRKFGYHLCLGGGVLNKGFSDKDLDLYFLPMTGNLEEVVKKENVDKLVGWLEKIWGPKEALGRGPFNIAAYNPTIREFIIQEIVEEYPLEIPYRIKCKFNYSGLRIDVFIL